MALYYRIYGNEAANISAKPPLVILHGMFGMGENWHSLAQALSQKWVVITVDLPGHGQSYDDATTKLSYSYHELYKPVCACLEMIQHDYPDLAANGFIICGHSMGAKIAMVLALRRPDLVLGLVAVDSGPFDYRGRGYNHEVIAMLTELPLDTFVERLDVSQAMAAWVKDPTLRSFLLKNLRKNDRGQLEWRFDARGLARGAADIADWPIEFGDFSPYTGPSLFLPGALSDYIRLPEDVAEIRHFFPVASIMQIPAAGHWPHVDNREAFLMHISQFMLTIE